MPNLLRWLDLKSPCSLEASLQTSTGWEIADVGNLDGVLPLVVWCGILDKFDDEVFVWVTRFRPLMPLVLIVTSLSPATTFSALTEPSLSWERLPQASITITFPFFGASSGLSILLVLRRVNRTSSEKFVFIVLGGSGGLKVLLSTVVRLVFKPDSGELNGPGFIVRTFCFLLSCSESSVDCLFGATLVKALNMSIWRIRVLSVFPPGQCQSGFGWPFRQRLGWLVLWSVWRTNGGHNMSWYQEFRPVTILISTTFRPSLGGYTCGFLNQLLATHRRCCSGLLFRISLLVGFCILSRDTD